MVNANEDAHAALLSVCPHVFFYHPSSFRKLPCVSFFESSNAPIHADNSEYASEITLNVSVWGADGRSVAELAAAANDAMYAAGFYREFAGDVFNPDSEVKYCKAMRFRITKG